DGGSGTEVYSDSSSLESVYMKSDLSSLLVPNSVWVVFNPSLADLVVSTRTLGFTSIVEHASQKAKNNSVPSVGQTSALPTGEEKNTNPAIKDVETTNLKDELIDLIGIDVVEKYHKNKLLEAVQACLDRKEKGWKTIYGLIKTRMDYHTQTKEELKIDFNKPLKEQDPLDELNDLANKKRKRGGDLSDDSRSTKKFKSSV
nr:hypothetical protein [Tanacetum cinerariifolium]